MSVSVLSREPEGDRRIRILAAAERAFARHGFHAATMQIVASEARMSAGNLYRYFGSKEALVSGLAERDQAAMADDFRLLSAAEDPVAAMEPLLRKHLVEAPVACAQMALEIWAEAGRNPAVAAICRSIDADVRGRLREVVEGPSRAAGLDPDFTLRVLLTVMAGLFKRRATEARFDGESEVVLALGLFAALFSGAVRPGVSHRRSVPA